MEDSQQQFQMPRELQRSTPRPIRRRSGAWGGCGLMFGRLFILPHMLVGVGMLLIIPLTFAKVYFGDVSEGWIVKKWTTSGEDDLVYHFRYEYDADGVHRAGERTCSRTQYNSIGDPSRGQTPQSIQIRGLRMFGRHFDEAMLPGESALKKVGFYVLFAAFWNAILSVFVYVMWIGPWRERQLYRWGTPVPGRICSKQTKSDSESTSYYLDYEFIQPQWGMQRKQQSVTSERYSAANEGQLVTVLCYPNKTSPAVIYEYGAFVCA